jgi:hypothetical protein
MARRATAGESSLVILPSPSRRRLRYTNELRHRQERYRRAGIRGAWFVPPGFCPAPSPTLPAFLEVERHAPDATRVRFGGGLSGTPATLLPLERFVAHLLRGRVRFEPEHVLCPLDSIIAVTAPDQCRRCAAPFEHVVGVTNIAFGPARFRIDGASIVALRDLWRGDRRQACAVIRGLGRLRLHSALGHRSPIDYEREHAQTPVLAA